MTTAITKATLNCPAKSLEEMICDLKTAAELLLGRLDKVSDAIMGIPTEHGGDIMDEWTAANWVAKRLNDDAQAVLRRFGEERVAAAA